VYATSQMLLVLDSAGTIVYANPATASNLKYRPDQLIGTSFVELLDVGSRNKGKLLLAQSQPYQQTAVFEVNQNTGDGEILLVGYQATALPASTAGNGASSRILLSGQPMSQVIATTERLIRLNRRLKALFSIVTATSHSIVLTDLLQHTLDVALSELEQLAGLVLLIDTPVQLDRSLDSPLLPQQIRLIAQQGLKPSFAAQLSQSQPLIDFWNAQMGSDTPDVISSDAKDLGIYADDLERAAGPLLNVLATPLISDRQLVGWLYMLSDRYRAADADELDLLRTIGTLLGRAIENARLYDALLQSSGRLQAVLDGIDSGVLLIDQEGVVRYANARLGKLLRADVGTWPGQPRAAVLPKHLVPARQPSEPFGDQLWEVATAESTCLLRRFADLIYDVNNEPIGSIELYSDVTSIQTMNRLKDEFIAAAAHDLKTPVTAIKGYAQIAIRLCRKLDEPRLMQQLAMINARSDELSYLMDALLDMSRLQGGRMRLDLDTFLIAELFANVAKHFDFDLTRRKRELRIDLPEQQLDVTWDRVRMAGVLINLIGNALKYSPNGEEVSVGVRISDPSHSSGQWVMITVTDHGIGIPPSERHHIFERFYRTPQAIEEGFKGTGIGLYIAQHIVELHGGRIWAADAIHGGQGLSMHLLMPCSSSAASFAKPPDSNSSA
jgi:two-component system, OmpR family, phosphate regulon sensor histidine kinase PhoR